jgi:hypothetical protein
MNPFYEQYRAEVSKLSNDELVERFNNDVRNPGWTTTRAVFHEAMIDEFKSRKIDIKVISTKNGVSWANKVKLVNDRLVLID